MIQKNWDKYKVALLIEAYQDIKHGRVDKNSAPYALSQNLRNMTVYSGYDIDEVFRYFSSICTQVSRIEVAFGRVRCMFLMFL